MWRIFPAFMLAFLFFILMYAAFIRNKDQGTKIDERLKFGLQSSEQDKGRNLTWNDYVKKQHDEDEQRPAKRLEDISFFERVIVPLRKSIGKFILRFAPSTIQRAIEKKLVLAGRPARRGSVGMFILQMLFFAVLFSGLVSLSLQGNPMAMVQKVTFTIMFFAMGAVFPVLILLRKIRERQNSIKRQLPEVLDLLVVSVEAGLSFDAALRRIVTRMKGPLIDECKKMLDDVKMGMTRRDALTAMDARCEVQDISLFVTSIIQAERLGSNMSGTLQAQADNVRDRHRQYIKAMALKAPVKIVIPLVLFILPAIFIVALGPPLLSAAKNLFK